MRGSPAVRRTLLPIPYQRPRPHQIQIQLQAPGCRFLQLDRRSRLECRCPQELEGCCRSYFLYLVQYQLHHFLREECRHLGQNHYSHNLRSRCQCLHFLRVDSRSCHRHQERCCFQVDCHWLADHRFLRVARGFPAGREGDCLQEIRFRREDSRCFQFQ